MVRRSHTFTLIVDNEFGVLTRITALIRRQGWNIQSLSVAETINLSKSRLTLQIECFDAALSMVLDRLGRLACVHSIEAFNHSTQFIRELALISVENNPTAELLLAELNAKLIHDNTQQKIYEITALPEDIDKIVKSLMCLDSISVTRTGGVTIPKLS